MATVGKAVPALDVSVTDRRWDCVRCAYAHKPGSVCPRPGVWLTNGAPVKPLQVVRP